MATPCPFCGGHSLVSGKLEGNEAVGFAPASLPGWSQIWPEREATLCLDCGGLWGKCDLAQVKKLIPDAAFALYCQGSRLEAKGEAQAALEKYEAAISACPGSAAATDAEASIRNLKATTNL